MSKQLPSKGMTKEVIDDLSTILPNEIVLHINYIFKTECKKVRRCSICRSQFHVRPQCLLERKVQLHEQMRNYRFVKSTSCDHCDAKKVPAFQIWQEPQDMAKRPIKPDLTECVLCAGQYFQRPELLDWWEEMTTELN